MKSLSTIAVLLLFVTPAWAQPRHAVISPFDFMPVPPAPANLSWRLATQGGAFVEFAIPQLTVSNGQIAYLVTPSTFSQFGVDFNAWSTAVVDPAYNRSIVTLAGMTKEQPFVHGFTPFNLDRLQLFVEGFHPSMNGVFVQGGLIDFLDVPEPATWLLVVVSIVAFTFTRKRG